MREVKFDKRERLDFKLANTIATLDEWREFCKKNDVGIIIEDGKVTGYEPNPKYYHI